jgi:hypothetical protein
VISIRGWVNRLLREDEPVQESGREDEHVSRDDVRRMAGTR